MSGNTGRTETDTQLLNEFADGQPAGSITPQDVRDIIASETSHITAAIGTALPSATASQLYGGTGAAGTATPITVGTNLTLSGGTLTAASGNYTPNNVAITGGTIDGTAIGSTTPSTGAFTNLSAINNGIAWSGSTAEANTQLNIQSTQGGTTTVSAFANLNYIQIVDYVNAGTSSTNGLELYHVFGGSGNGGTSTGGKQGLYVNLVQQAATNSNGVGLNPNFVGAQFTASCAHNEGGTGNTFGTTGRGQLYAFSGAAILYPGATDFTSLIGCEIDLQAKSGSSCHYKTGLSIVKLNGDVVSGGDGNDTAFFIGDQSGTTAGWDYGIALGNGYSYWPFKSTASLIAVRPQNGGTPLSAATGIDFTPINFGTAAIQTLGYTVDPVGNVISGNKLSLSNYTLTPSSTGLTIDAPNQVARTVAVAAGGSGYNVGDILTTASGGVYSVATLSGSAVATITQLVPDISASPPANPVATTNKNHNIYNTGGSGCTLTLTWTASNTLALAPTGSVTAPTPSASDNSTKVATTAFVQARSIYAYVYLNASQTVSSATATKCNFDTVQFDSAGAYDHTTNYRYTATTAGKYKVTVSMVMSATTGAQGANWFAYIYKNGTAYAKSSFTSPNGNNGSVTLSCVAVVSLNGSSDYIEGWGQIPGTAGETFLPASSGICSSMTIEYLGP